MKWVLGSSLFYCYLIGMKYCSLILLTFLINACRSPDRPIVDYGVSYYREVTDTAFLFPTTYRQPAVDSLEYHELSKLLQVFHEKPLHQYATNTPVLRFYYSGWFRIPVIVRIDNKQVVIKKANFHQNPFESLYDSVTKKEIPNFLYQRITFPTSPEKFKALLNYIDTTSFWKTSRISSSRGGADGEGWNVEIIRNKQYNHVQEWSPTGNSFYHLCLQILNYANLEKEKPR
jgi:hypothetical protein